MTCNSTLRIGSNLRRVSLKGSKEGQAIIIVWETVIIGVLGA